MPLGSQMADRWEIERRRNDRQVLWMARISFLLFGTSPWWVPAVKGPLGPLGLVLDSMFVLVCHRLPERSLEIAGALMPVCSRCAGIFTGLALGAALLRPHITIKQARFALLAAGLLMLTDVVTQDLGIHPVWHSTRLLTGILVGWVLSSTLFTTIRQERGMLGPVAPPGRDPRGAPPKSGT